MECEREESQVTLNLSRSKDGVAVQKCREDGGRCRCKRPAVLHVVNPSGDVESAVNTQVCDSGARPGLQMEIPGTHSEILM